MNFQLLRCTADFDALVSRHRSYYYGHFEVGNAPDSYPCLLVGEDWQFRRVSVVLRLGALVLRHVIISGFVRAARGIKCLVARGAGHVWRLERRPGLKLVMPL